MDKQKRKPMHLKIINKVLDAFDETWKRLGLPTRTAAIHDAMLDWIEKHTEA